PGSQESECGSSHKTRQHRVAARNIASVRHPHTSFAAAISLHSLLENSHRRPGISQGELWCFPGQQNRCRFRRCIRQLTSPDKGSTSIDLSIKTYGFASKILSSPTAVILRNSPLQSGVKPPVVTVGLYKSPDAAKLK